MKLTRQTKLIIGMSAFVVLVVVLASIVLDMSIERALLLAPLLVVTVLALAGLVLFWGKVAITQIRGQDKIDDASPFARPGGNAPRPRDGGGSE